MEVRPTCVLMWLGIQVAAQAICLSFQIGQILRTFTIPPTISTTGIHLGFENDYNYPQATTILPFWARYVIMHKVYISASSDLFLISLQRDSKYQPKSTICGDVGKTCQCEVGFSLTYKLQTEHSILIISRAAYK